MLHHQECFCRSLILPRTAHLDIFNCVSFRHTDDVSTLSKDDDIIGVVAMGENSSEFFRKSSQNGNDIPQSRKTFENNRHDIKILN